MFVSHTCMTEDECLQYIKTSQNLTVKSNSFRKWVKYMNRHFMEDDTQMANKLVKRYSAPVTSREI